MVHIEEMAEASFKDSKSLHMCGITYWRGDKNLTFIAVLLYQRSCSPRYESKVFLKRNICLTIFEINFGKKTLDAMSFEIVQIQIKPFCCVLWR